MSTRRNLFAPVLTCFLACGPAVLATPRSAVAAEADLRAKAAEVSGQVAAQREAVRRVRAEEAVIANENAILKEARNSPPPPNTALSDLDSEARSAVVEGFEAALRGRNENLDHGPARTARDQCESLARKASVLCMKAGQSRDLAPFQLDQESRHCLAPAGKPVGFWRLACDGAVLSMLALGMTITLLIACAILLDRLVSVRRFLRPWANKMHNARSIGRTNSTIAVLILAALALSSVSCSRSGAGALSPEERVARLETEQRDLSTAAQNGQRDLASARVENEKEAKAQISGWVDHAIGPSSAAADASVPPRPSATLVEAETITRQTVRKLAVDAEVAKTALADASADIGELEKASAQIKTYRDATATYGGEVSRTKTMLWSLFFCVNLGLVFVWHSRRRAAARRTRGTCPRCLSFGKLKERQSQEYDENNPDGRIVECGECHYQMRPAHRESQRLCVPTLGYPQSGKTLWLIMFHELVRYGRASTALAHLERMRSLTAGEEAEFDATIQEVLAHHEPAHTRMDPKNIPWPILFHFSNSAVFGPDSGLVNIFDFAGSTMYRDFEGTRLQERALNMDGFLYFLDPTRPETFESQNEELRHFRDRIRAKTPVGQGLSAPVAVCITKLDMLAKDVAGKGVFRTFVERLQQGPDASSPDNGSTVDQPPSLSRIRWRHDLFRDWRTTLFPGWEVEEQFSNLFGGRYMFFPMSSVGFLEPGEKDLAKRNYQPFAIVEPILWLLHMSGFQTLREA